MCLARVIGMDSSQYRTLLDEVRNDIAEAERTISELSPLENYLLGKLDASGDSAAKSGDRQKSSGKSSESESKSVDSNPGRQGMQTIEFGPDGFPST